jgi:hypothetical protein
VKLGPDQRHEPRRLDGRMVQPAAEGFRIGDPRQEALGQREEAA